MREYDTVEVLVEEYGEHGVHRGMVWTVLEPEKIDGGWMVYFADETGADTITCRIEEKDLKLVSRGNKTDD